MHARLTHFDLSLQVRKVIIAPVCYINKPLDTNMKCKEHKEGCGAYLQVGNLCYIDGSECTFVEGHYLISVRLLNHLGLRTCKVGYAKVLCNQVHLLCNHVGVVSSIFAKRDGKVFECDQHSEKEITLEVEDVIDVDEPKTSSKKKDKKDSKGKKGNHAKPPVKGRPNNLKRFHENMRAALAKNSDQTLHVVHSAFGIANLTMLDGGYPGSQPITSPESIKEPTDTDDGDDDPSEDDDDSLYTEGTKNKKKRKRTTKREHK